jgi:uncharacterized membrane protein
MRLWFIPLTYAVLATIFGFTLPRLEHAYLASYATISVSSAQAFLSAVASGMMALTGIVFSVAFVVVQFSAVAYSPRLVLWLSRDPLLFHSLGMFMATFIYSLSELAWVDRGASGKVPLFSALMVAALLLLSMLLFSRLIQSLHDLQISNILQAIGKRGRGVIAEMAERVDELPEKCRQSSMSAEHSFGPVTQTVTYSGEPRAIARFDIERLVRIAQQADAVIVMACAVGDTIFDAGLLLSVHGGEASIPKGELLRAVELRPERTFEQDPKYPMRLLVDIAIKALSPAVNDPTTAVQAIDQIEDLLRRLGRRELEAGQERDAGGKLRLVYPMPNWDDYLALAFDEIRLFGSTSVQVMRRLRSTLVDLIAMQTDPERADAVRRYLLHLDLGIERSPFDEKDRATARQEDRQGLGMTRRSGRSVKPS